MPTPSLWTRIGGMVEHGLDVELHKRRIALAEQTTSVESAEWIVIVNVVIVSFTLLGAGMILTSMVINEFVRGRTGTTRTRIVQALIASDLIIGLTGLISSSLTLVDNGRLFQHGSSACSGLGFLLTTTLWTEHLWTLTLAFATYMILIKPLHTVTLWLERKWYYLWMIVWVLSSMVGLIGYEVYGYYPSGGLCFYGDNTGLYAELIQFIPRAVVCLTISILYSRLIVFLRRPDKIRASDSRNGSSSGVYETVQSQGRHRLSSVGRLFRWRRRTSHPDEEGRHIPTKIVTDSVDSSMATPTPFDDAPRKTSKGLNLPFTKPRSQPTSPHSPSIPLADLPPWERIELPPFEVDGERFGGSSISPVGNSLWSGWKGMGGRKRPSTGSVVVSPQQQSASRFGSVSSTGDASVGSTLQQNRSMTEVSMAPRMQSIPSGQDVVFPSVYAPVPPVQLHELVNQGSQRASEHSDGTSVDHLRKTSSGRTMVDPFWPSSRPLSPGSYGPGSIPSSEWDTPLTEKKRPSVTTIVDEGESVNPSRGNSVSSESSRFLPGVLYQPQPMSYHHSKTLSPVISQYSQSQSQSQLPNQSILNVSTRHQTKSYQSSRFAAEVEAGTRSAPADIAEGDDGDEWDLMRVLATAPAEADDRFAPPQGEIVELVPESMSSYLNRKTALLMLWFPLGYVFLFSVSFVRLIYDFAGEPPIALRAISRWFILAQGLLDAIIYGVIEWHTKRVVRRRVRKGTFSPHHSGTATGGSNMVQSTTRALHGLASRLTGPQGGGSGSRVGTGSGTGSGNKAGSTSGGGTATPGQTTSGLFGRQKGSESGTGVNSRTE